MRVEVFVDGKLKFAFDESFCGIETDKLKKEVHDCINYGIDEEQLITVKILESDE